jgi:hypothetical protein
MNMLYQVALLEGYLAKDYDLPPNIQGAIDYLKALDQSKEVAKKKRKMTKEQRIQNAANLEKGRAVRKKNLEDAKKAEALKLAA